MGNMIQFFTDVRTFSPIFGEAVVYTILLWIGSLVVATILGLVLAAIEWLEIPYASQAVRTYITLIRGVPILVQLFYIFFLLPSIGIELTAYWSAVAGLGFGFAAYTAEVFRAGILAIDRGHVEAANSLAMSRVLIVRRIILPQAVITSLPGYCNIAVIVLKTTSIASVIAVPELTRAANLLTQATYKSLTIYTMLAFCYLCLSIPLVLTVRKLERWAAAR